MEEERDPQNEDQAPPQGPQVETADRPDTSQSEAAEATANESIPAATDEASRLRELHTDIRDQDDLERDISYQVYRFLWLV